MDLTFYVEPVTQPDDGYHYASQIYHLLACKDVSRRHAEPLYGISLSSFCAPPAFGLFFGKRMASAEVDHHAFEHTHAGKRLIARYITCPTCLPKDGIRSIVV